MSIKEEWRDIKGFEGRYKISNIGRVLSLPKPRRVIVFNKAEITRMSKEIIISGRKDKDGYIMVDLSDGDRLHKKKVHRLVAEAFLPLVKGKNLVNHKNGKKDDNRVENLEWCTNRENAIHAHHVLYGEDHHYYKDKACVQFTLNGEFVKCYKSVSAAAKHIGCSSTAINDCCNGHHPQSCGFIWRFKEDSNLKIQPYRKKKNEQRSRVIKIANKLASTEKISQSLAMHKAWQIEKKQNN